MATATSSSHSTDLTREQWRHSIEHGFDLGALPRVEVSGHDSDDETTHDTAIDMDNLDSPTTLETKPMLPNRFTAKVTGTQMRTAEEDGDYVVYEMEVHDSETGLTSYVFRRYQEFYDLYTHMINKYPELKDAPVKFPPKRWFGKNSERVINERKAGFEAYINYLLEHHAYASDPVLMEFIKSDMAMLKKALSYFRAKLYQIRQNKKLDHDEAEQMRKIAEQEKKMKDTIEKIKLINNQTCNSARSRSQSIAFGAADQYGRRNTMIQMPVTARETSSPPLTNQQQVRGRSKSVSAAMAQTHARPAALAAAAAGTTTHQQKPSPLVV